MLKPTAFATAAPAFTAPVPAASAREPAAHPFAEVLRQSRAATPPPAEAQSTHLALQATVPTPKPPASVHRDTPTATPRSTDAARAPAAGASSAAGAASTASPAAAAADRAAASVRAAAGHATAEGSIDAAGDVPDGTDRADDADVALGTPDATARGAARAAASRGRPRDSARPDGRLRTSGPATGSSTGSSTDPANDAAAAADTAKRTPAQRDDATMVGTNDPALVRWLAEAHAARGARPSDPTRATGAGAGDVADADGATGAGVAAAAAAAADAGSHRAAGIDAATLPGARDDDGQAARLPAHAAGSDALRRLDAGDRAGSGRSLDGFEPARPKPDATAPTRDDAPLGAAPFSIAALLPPLSGPTDRAPPLDVQLPSAPGAPDFAGTLGLQVSLLAQDGVQTAELHLNPADLGPVSVQIAIDGTEARVDFGADVATTRQAIEAGLPELASALRDAGLTLTGGGVSEHPRSRDESPGHGSARGRGPTGAGAGRAPAPVGLDGALDTRLRSGVAGGVDLYA